MRLRTREGSREYVLNATTLTEAFVNFTRIGSRRGEFSAGVSYDVDLQDPSAAAWVNQFRSSSVELIVWLWYNPNLSHTVCAAKP